MLHPSKSSILFTIIFEIQTGSTALKDLKICVITVTAITGAKRFTIGIVKRNVMPKPVKNNFRLLALRILFMSDDCKCRNATNS